MSDASQTKEFPLDPAIPGFSVIVKPSPARNGAIIELKEPGEKTAHVINIPMNSEYPLDKALSELKDHLSADPAAAQYLQDEMMIRLKENVSEAVKSILHDENHALKAASAQAASENVPPVSNGNGHVPANMHPLSHNHAARHGSSRPAFSEIRRTPEQLERLGSQIEGALLEITKNQRGLLLEACRQSPIGETIRTSNPEAIIQEAIDRAAKNWRTYSSPNHQSAFTVVREELRKPRALGAPLPADNQTRSR